MIGTQSTTFAGHVLSTYTFQVEWPLLLSPQRNEQMQRTANKEEHLKIRNVEKIYQQKRSSHLLNEYIRVGDRNWSQRYNRNNIFNII